MTFQVERLWCDLFKRNAIIPFDILHVILMNFEPHFTTTVNGKKNNSQHIEWLMQHQHFDEINKLVEYSQFFDFNFTKSYLLLHPMSMCPFIWMPRLYFNLTAPFLFLDSKRVL